MKPTQVIVRVGDPIYYNDYDINTISYEDIHRLTDELRNNIWELREDIYGREDQEELSIGSPEESSKKPKFNLYTVPGQVYYASSRKIILNGVDGVVFVADSQKDRMEGNIETLLDLENNLMAMGYSLENYPWVIQYNKRDLPNTEPIEMLQKKLNFFNVPYFEGVAIKGTGVFDTLKAIINLVVQHVQRQL